MNRRLLVGIGLVALVVSACASGSGDEALETFCTATIDGEALFNMGPEVDEEGVPTEEGLAEFGAELTPYLDDIETNAPEEVADEVATVIGAVRTALETGDPGPTETEEVFMADSAIDQYVFDNCELDSRNEMTAVDYAYQDAPETLEAGTVGLSLDNQGTEVHEIAVLRINDDVDLSGAELLELPEEEAQSMVEFKGVVFAPPGTSSSGVVDLEEGRYVFVCFIPVGATSIDTIEEVSGPPHFTQGMFAEVEVS